MGGGVAGKRVRVALVAVVVAAACAGGTASLVGHSAHRVSAEHSVGVSAPKPTGSVSPSSSEPPEPSTSSSSPDIGSVSSAVPVLPARPGGRPGPQNTGVPAGTALHAVVGTVTVTRDGTVIDAVDIKGSLIIRANNVVVVRSLIEGGAGMDSVEVASGTGIVLQDDEIGVAHPAAGIDSMHVVNATLDRLNIHGGVDGIKLGSNSTVENSWIHDLSYFASDPSQGGGPTHNDTIQITSGTNIHIVGNYLDAARSDNSAIQITQDYGTVSGVYISDNWADGGGCTFNISGHGRGGRLLAMSGIFATGNRFGRDMKFAHCAMLVDRQTTLVQSGNVYDDTGAAIKITRHN